MFAVYAEEPNADAPLDALTSATDPNPRSPTAGCRHRRAASLNMHDLWTLRGVGIKPEQFPMILGCDGAGTLEDGTEVVLHSIIGDPAWDGDETLDPKRTLLTEKHQGTFADIVSPGAQRVPRPPGSRRPGVGDGHRVAHRLPDAVREVRPAAWPDHARAGRVRWRVHRTGPARPGRGHEGLGHRPHGGEAGARRAAGAHATFPSRARLPERVDAVFETVGDATWSHSMRALKPGGIIVVSGATSGPTPAPICSGSSSCSSASSGSTMGSRKELPTCSPSSPTPGSARKSGSSSRWIGPRRVCGRCWTGRRQARSCSLAETGCWAF